MPTYMGDDEVIEKNLTYDPEHIYTTEYMEALPEDVRMELIDGRLYYKATPLRFHQALVGFLTYSIANYIKANNCACEVLLSPLALYLNKDNLTYLEPDVMVVCDPEKMDEKGCHGAPDFVAEIVSPSSRSRDYLLKLIQYQAAGVREYWIVDAEWRMVLVYAFEESEVRIYNIKDRISVGIIDGLVLDFSELQF